ncbi:hypothetical protein [Hymenobacter montanus]|nr:hypothetical protein [Hymenobacter montanus]
MLALPGDYAVLGYSDDPDNSSDDDNRYWRPGQEHLRAALAPPGLRLSVEGKARPFLAWSH